MESAGGKEPAGFVDTVLELFIRPPLAIARLGDSDVPLECFDWSTDRKLGGAHGTVIRPAVTLEVMADGSVYPYWPNVIRFRDGERLRPVAPFFELWAVVQTADERTTTEPVTLKLLDRVGGSVAGVQYTLTVANRKAQRRTGSAACAFIAQVTVGGGDHERKPLLAISPHNADQKPLVVADRPIPLGHVQVIRPVLSTAMGIDLSVLRVRFTPARGEVYGPPRAIAGPASPLPPGLALPAETLGGRIHEIVPEANRILNPDTPWSDYRMNQPGQSDPQPSDSYDGANVGDDQSWGVVDDTCDGVLQAEVIVRGKRFVATARVLSACPDFAPDRRPFFSFADDLADRDLDPAASDGDALPDAESEIADLFERVFETVSLMNVDATRLHGIYENDGTPTANYDGLPRIDDKTMTAEETPGFVNLIPDLLNVQGQPPNADDRLPYTAVAQRAHADLADIEILLDFLRSNRERVKRLLRPPFGRFRELIPDPEPKPQPDFRDPRVVRDTQQDMRMPPYLRDSDQTPLSLTWRQYHAVMALLEHAAREDDASAAQAEGPRRRTPLAREVARIAERVRKAVAQNGGNGGHV